MLDCGACTWRIQGKKNNYLDVISVTRAVCMSIMSVGRGVFYMRGIDGDASGLLLRRIVNVFIFFVVRATSITKH